MGHNYSKETIEHLPYSSSNQIFISADEVPRLEPIFPSAEGPGKYCQGGKGGKVSWITTREDSGNAGSLRWAIEQTGAIIIRFKVGGIFSCSKGLKRTNPFITIDGSDAPDPVIIKDATLAIISTHDVFLTQIRVRPGDEVALKKKYKGAPPRDGITVEDSAYIMIDHISVSWSSDELLSVTGSSHVTISHILMSEPLANPKLHNGEEHNFGALQSGDQVLYFNTIIDNYRIRGTQMSNGKVGLINSWLSNCGGSGTRISVRSNEDYYIQAIIKSNTYGPISLDANDVPPTIEFVDQEKDNNRTEDSNFIDIRTTKLYIH